jgi:pyrroloquinoline-quinone synthase
VCDEYVQLVRERALVEAVASSLTELFAPTLMSQRIQAWRQHYPWIKPEALEYFQTRISRASSDSREAMGFVLEHATTYELQEGCVQALVNKTQILWQMLDCIYTASVNPNLPGEPLHDEPVNQTVPELQSSTALR